MKNINQPAFVAALLAALVHMATLSWAHDQHVDVGLRFKDGTAAMPIAAEPAGARSSPLRIRASDGKAYGVLLVDPSDASASKARVMTDQGLKSLVLLSSAAAESFDLRQMPMGDGRFSDQPKVGYIYPCSPQRDYSGVNGAHALGPWIHGSTWDTTQKMTVLGSAQYPAAHFSIAVSGASRQFTGDELPVGARSGTYPTQDTDPAYPIDQNPNLNRPQSLSFSSPLEPQLAAGPSCVEISIIGVALDGVPFFSALDSQGHDASAHEILDECNGHPNPGGTYHYHSLSPCIPHINENNALVGYALDGFGIFSPYAQDGRELAAADLDECHGKTSLIPWDGQMRNMYHYVLTRDYPYTIGCFRGTPVRLTSAPPPPGSPGGNSAAPVDKAPAAGSLSAVSCAEAAGSASDDDNPSRPVTILFYIDGPREAASASQAGKYLGAVIANHNFSFRLPSTIRNDNTHALYAYAMDINSAGYATSAYPMLAGSPAVLNCH